MKKLFIVCVMLIASSFTAWADSPITSTSFAKAYQDVPIVSRMLQLNGQVVTQELINYLADDQNPIDVKVAAINAVDISKDVYTPLMNLLKTRLGTDSEISVLARISGSTHAALAYARARHFYDNLREAGVLAHSVLLKEPDSFTANMVYALVISNAMMDSGQWDAIYPICNNIKIDPALTQDMRPQAITMLMEYINLYKEYVKKTN